MMGKVRFVAGGGVWDEICSAASRAGRGKATVVVSYLTDDEFLPLRSGDTLVVNLDDAKLKAGLTDPTLVLKYLEAGVKTFRSPGLHAKVYIFGNKTIIGSPNASKNSRVQGESVAIIDGVKSANAARQMIATSLPLLPVDQATLKGMKQIYRPARGGGRPVPLVPQPLDPKTDRLWLQPFKFGHLPEHVLTVANSKLRAARRQAGRSDVTQIDSYLSRQPDPLNKGDLVIFLDEATNPDGAVVYPPARILDRHDLPRAGKSADVLFTLRTSRAHDAVTVAQLRQVLHGLGMRHTDKQRQMKDLKVRQAMLALWDDLPSL
jgi:hypothetical protein